MTKYTQEEYIKLAINYLNDMGYMKIEKAHELAIMDLPSSIKWDFVEAYMGRDKYQMIEILKTNLNI